MTQRELLRLPYPGLRPFEPYEADLFFGRERHVDALLKRLSNSHFVAVVGESGAGKSSLVRAGLLPALDAGFVVEAGSDWRVAMMRPGGAPLSALVDALLVPRVLSEEGGAPRREFALAELCRGPLGLVQLVRDAHLQDHCNLLVVVDQFEELFRYCREPAQKDQANIFVELLLQASLQRDVPTLVVVTMRSDFIGDCARFRGLPERLNDNQYLTPRLTRDQIAEAIKGPARVCAGEVKDPLVDELCNAVGDHQDQLPLLQHLLMRLWERASENSDRPCLTPELSKAMGGLHSALNDHAQQIYDSLANEETRSIARVLFKSLTDPHSSRRDVRRDALVSEVAAVAAVPVESVVAVAEEFRADGRHMLMPPPPVPLDADSRLDISHESLIRQWSTLNEWAGEESANAREFERLREEAQREREGEGELLSGRDLVRALDWIKQARPTSSWAERYAPAGELDTTLAFIRKSEAEEKKKKEDELRMVAREAAAKRSRYYNRIFAGMLLLAVGLLVGSAYLWKEADAERVWSAKLWKEAVEQKRIAEDSAAKMETAARYAEEQKERAEELAEVVKKQNESLSQERSQARSRQLAADTMLELTNDPSLAVVLAREAILEPQSDERAILALRRALADHVPSVTLPLPSVAQLKNYIPGTNKQSWLEFSFSPSSLSSRDDLAIIPSGNDAIIWSTLSGKPVLLLRGHKNIVGSAGFSPNGELAVTTSADNTARVWDASTGKSLRHLNHGDMINGAVFSTDGQVLVTVSDDNTARVWSIDSAMPRCVLEHDGDVTSASFSQDGNRLVTVTIQPAARLWNVGPQSCSPIKVPFFEEKKGAAIKFASFSPDGRWLGLVTPGGDGAVLDAADWTMKREFDLAPFPGNTEPPKLAWSSDSSYFAVAGGDNVVQVQATVSKTPAALPPESGGGLAGILGRIQDAQRQIGMLADRPVELRGHTGRVTSIAFNPEGDIILTTSEDGTARLWKLGTNKQLLESLVLRGNKDTVVGSGVFAQKATQIITANEDGTVRLWKPLFPLKEKHVPSLDAASFSRDGKKIWIVAGKVAYETATADNLEVQNTFKIPSNKPWMALYVSAEPKLIERAYRSGISVAPIHEPSKLFFLPGSESLQIDGISFDGRFIFATAGDGGSIKVWDVNAPQMVPRIVPLPRIENKPCPAYGISHDGERLAWYCPESNNVLITGPARRERDATKKVEKVIASVGFSKDGRKLAVAFDDYSVQVLDSDDGKPHSTMRGHTGPIPGIHFSQDGRFLATASYDSTARVWDVESGQEVAMVAVPGRQLTGVTFSLDGLSLLLRSSSSVLLWRCYACGDTTTLLNEARQRNIVRPLARDEQRRFGLSNGLSSGTPAR